MDLSRRNFLATAALSSASVALSASELSAQMQGMDHTQHRDDAHHGEHAQHNHVKEERPVIPRLPALICKVTSTISIDAAYKMLTDGSDTLDVALHICKSQEDDPTDHSTGLGSLPNSQGEVQLDACCFHGPTRRCAAVSCVPGIRNAALLARTLMNETGYAVLVGSDAQAFALSRGFVKEDLFTDRARKNYTLWKQIASKSPENVVYDPSWPASARKAHFLSASQVDFDLLVHGLEPLAVQAGLSPTSTWRAVYDSLAPASEPLFVSAVDRKGQLSAASTSGGRPWRLPGISSDVATLGAGSFIDPDVGSAGSSGNAEANIRIAGAHTIIENLRMGMSPEEAGMDALRRIARSYNNDMAALRFVEMVYYILRKDGAYASVSLWKGDRTGHVRQFTVIDAQDTRRTEDCVPLFPCGPMNGCALPR